MKNTEGVKNYETLINLNLVNCQILFKQVN